METYLIGICNRLHDGTIILCILSVILSVIFTFIYVDGQTDVKLGYSTKIDNASIKVGKRGLITCLIVFIISFLLCTFVPTGEEISLIMQMQKLNEICLTSFN